MVRIVVLVAPLAFAVSVGCSFDGSGPSQLSSADLATHEASPPRDARQDFTSPPTDLGVDDGGAERPPSDGPATDRRALDFTADGGPPDATVDTRSPDATVDTRSPDATVDTRSPDSTLDTQPSIVPVSSAALGQALLAEMVECLDNTGANAGADIAVADSATVTFYDGAVTLAGAVQETLTWVGGRSAVTIRYDLNSCGDEWVLGGGWGSTGLLVRGAQLVSGELVLAAGTTTADIDLIDINGDGTFQQTFDPGGADDASLPPQLVLPVRAAKQVILRLGGL